MALIQRSDLGQAAVGDEINSLSAPVHFRDRQKILQLRHG